LPVHFRTWTWKVGNTFSSNSHSSLPFIFLFYFGRTDIGRESMIWFVLVSATGPPSAVMSSLLTIWKISTIK
jgi:hypothetical protein